MKQALNTILIYIISGGREEGEFEVVKGSNIMRIKGGGNPDVFYKKDLFYSLSINIK